MHIEFGKVVEDSLAIEVFLSQECFNFVRLDHVFINCEEFVVNLFIDKVYPQGKTSELLLHLHQNVSRED